jgi:hypothetical integral membrane protein (TIGR02206 family)
MQSQPTMSSWSESFEPYTEFHGLVLGVCASIMLTWIIIGRILIKLDERDGLELGSAGREFRLRRWIALTIVLTQGFIFVRRFVYFDLQDSLPLHMCRLGVWISAWMLWTLDRRARSLTLFWGIGLSAQIFFTPFLEEGYAHLGFWIYWLNHVQIVGVALYDIFVLGYRPNAKDLRFASIAGVIFAVVVIALNALLGTNYSYLGASTHEGSSIVDKLGDYPERTIWMIVASIVIFCVIYAFSRLLGIVRVRLLKKAPVREISP